MTLPPTLRPAVGLWRALTAKSTGLGLILALGGLTLVGTLLPQLPDAAREDPVALADWLAGVRPKLGGLADVLLRLRLLDVFHSPLFATVALLLALSTLACTINRTPGIRRGLVGDDTTGERAVQRTAERTLAHPAVRLERSVARPAETATAELERTLRAARYRVVRAPGTGLVHADRFRYAALATLVAHAGLVVVLLGVALSALIGFRDADVPVVVGDRHPVGHGTGLTVTAEAFADSYHPNGTPKDYASQVRLTDATGAVVAAGTIRVNDPLRHDGLAIYQSTYGVAAVLQIVDPTGATLRADHGVPLRWSADDGAHAVGVLDLPELDRQLAVVSPASGRPDPAIPPGTVRVLAYADHGARLVGQTLARAGQPALVGDVQVTFVRERQFTGLSIARDPAASWVWLGALLLVVGMSVTFALRPRRLAAQVTPDPDDPACSRVELAAPPRAGLAEEDLAAHLAELLDALPPPVVRPVPVPS
ncbi:MAG TPA: cytochrome c biogenesis protein ResB [Dermatophilaceae bacterium]|nr:cytochrome c biogenesis protein ResB [Dermatophilaceae bacterium]